MNQLNPVDVPAPSVAADPILFPIRFYPPGSRQWLVKAPKNRWKWVGDADLHLEGDALVLQGGRYRVLLPTARQEVRIPLQSILNVAQSARSVQLQVKSETGKSDRLQFWTADAEVAARIASLLPTEQSADFALT